MPKNRSVRLTFVLVVCLALCIIGHNLYQRHLRQEFVEALRKGDRAQTLTLLQRGLDPNEPVRYVSKDKGMSLYSPEIVSPLYFAVEASDAPLVDLLLAHGARPDSLAFNLATSHHSHVIAMTLLEHGADPNARSSFYIQSKDTPLTDAARPPDIYGSLDAPLLKALLDRGADPNVKDSFSQTALMWVCSQGRRDMALLLLSHGADPNVMDADGRTALTRAIEKPDIALVRLLLTHKVDVNVHNSFGPTALISAALRGDVTIVKLLLATGADVHVRFKSPRQGSQEWTVLKMARQSKHPEIVRLLQHAGATE